MPLNSKAQDIIIRNDGSEILSKVIEVTQSDVKYKKLSNPNGPTYTISISDIKSITYENGEQDSFNKPSEALQGYVNKPADSRNAEIIAQYNQIYQPSKKIDKSNKAANRCLILIGITKRSIMSNNDIEMTFEPNKLETPYYVPYLCYGLKIRNKSNHPIYIDKARCFKSSSEGEVYCYNNKNDNIINNKISNRFIVIPPNMTRFLVEERWDGNKLIEGMERFRFKDMRPEDIGIHHGIIKQGQVKVFNEMELPWNRCYYITYCHDDSFKTFSLLRAELYIKEIIGCQSLKSVMNYRPGLGGVFEGELKFEKFIKDYDNYAIVGYHKFDKESSVYHSSSYVAESLTRTNDDNIKLANAITGTALSTMNAFVQMQQGGVSPSNGSMYNGGTNNGLHPIYQSMQSELFSNMWKDGVPATTNSVLSNSGGITTSSSGVSNGSTSSSTRKATTSQHDLCNGTGKCKTCNGSGQMWVGTNKKQCVNCGGSGRCRGCNGTGKGSSHYY